MNISKSMFKNLSRCKDFASIYDMYIFRNAHHIKEIEGEDVKGIIKPIDVVFNKTDINIKYSIISNLIEEEKLDVARNQEKYGNLRFDYETLIQTLSNNAKRKDLVEKSEKRLETEITENKKGYDLFINEKRTEKLSAHENVL